MISPEAQPAAPRSWPPIVRTASPTRLQRLRVRACTEVMIMVGFAVWAVAWVATAGPAMRALVPAIMAVLTVVPAARDLHGLARAPHRRITLDRDGLSTQGWTTSVHVPTADLTSMWVKQLGHPRQRHPHRFVLIVRARRADLRLDLAGFDPVAVANAVAAHRARYWSGAETATVDDDGDRAGDHAQPGTDDRTVPPRSAGSPGPLPAAPSRPRAAAPSRPPAAVSFRPPKGILLMPLLFAVLSTLGAGYVFVRALGEGGNPFHQAYLVGSGVLALGVTAALVAHTARFRFRSRVDVGPYGITLVLPSQPDRPVRLPWAWIAVAEVRVGPDPRSQGTGRSSRQRLHLRITSRPYDSAVLDVLETSRGTIEYPLAGYDGEALRTAIAAHRP
ncbi:hypothetical protein [Pseudonocardia sp. HH130630-07]|uniref:hypothetical protein n=1 Tax=Pseudonocardia sp. HH130630-07 TaxID=1690815 RepID=UPI000815018C|nr:hypothetical protein [Pseudonocardia sp. HH130630-07]ANY05404.1 hypothetical protein AFB00_02730 [Pseudonocardia sp. HH130630-07]